MDDSPDHTVTVSHVIAASADALYAAWTDPAIMARWMGKVTEADAQVGGRYRIEHAAGGGAVYVHKGEYRVLEPGTRIVQTFAAGPAEGEPAGGVSANGEFVELRLRPLEGGERTEVTLINGWNGAGLEPDGMAALEQAWSHWLTLLDRTVAAPTL
jgi:uncharacterized protein YndB with AHSA1/START domain